MYFPPDSWGKFTVDMLPKETFETIYDNALKDMPIDKILANMFNNSEPNRVDIMKSLLEGLRMPVKNPKTGEMDYVDTSLVDKIVIDSNYLVNMVTNQKVKVDFTVSSDKNTQYVLIAAKIESLDVKRFSSISLQSFEEMLYKAINEIKSQRLEEVKEFTDVLSNLCFELITVLKNSSQYYTLIDHEYELNNGIGIIRDTKTNQEIGTFETVHFTYEQKRTLVNIEDILLSGRTLDDMLEQNRFEFTFYSLDNNLLYSFIGDKNSDIKNDKEFNAIDILDSSVLIDTFEEKHKHYTMIANAQEKKQIIQSIDANHPLWGSTREEFRSSRLAILEESKTKQKEEQLLNQFTDIDLGF